MITKVALFFLVAFSSFAMTWARTQAPTASICQMTGNITCSIKATGGSCNSYTVPTSSNCSSIPVTYKFSYCNSRNASLLLVSSKSYLKSEFFSYNFTNLTIPPGRCIVQRNYGILKSCSRVTFASLQLNGYYTQGSSKTWCFDFKYLKVEPNFLTFAPSKKPVNKPTKGPISKAPTIRPTYPTKKVTLLPTKKPSYGKPTKKPTTPSFRAPTIQPIKATSASPFVRAPSRPPSKAPTKVPSKRPTKGKGPTRKPTKGQTSIPTVVDACGSTKTARSNGLATTVSSISTSIAQALTNSSSPQSLALSWLINQDGLYLCPTDTRVRQRFIVASFYFSTGGDSSWVMCGRNSVQTCSITQTLTFVPGDNTTYRYSNAVWLTAVDECLWGGTVCFDGNGTLERIEFNRNAANKLKGTIPGEITLLSNMRTFVIESCCSTSIPTYNVTGYAGIQGTIPSGIGNLQSMFTLNLAYNFLTGTVPASIVTLSKLREISLQYNNLVGSFPSPQNSTQLTKIKYVRIESNSFNGTVPNIVYSTFLSNYTLQANKITGQMPQAICNLVNPPPGGSKVLVQLWSDCSGGPAAKVNCPCCDKCF